MIVILVARKPVEGTVANNALKYGTGGINIDGCRVGINPEERELVDSRSGKSTAKYEGWGTITNRDEGVLFKSHPAGRWPANLIFEHKPGCKIVGEAQKATRADTRADTRPDGDGGREDRTNWRFRPTEATRRGYGGEDGVETVPVWDCLPGCPVAELDRQSGDRRSAGLYPTTYVDSQNRIYGKGVGKGQGQLYEDVGGASRFFKQIQDTSDDETLV